LPQPLFTATPTEGCPPLPVVFNDASSSNDGTIVNWNWDFENSRISTSQNPYLIYTESGLFDVTLSVTTDLGCSNTLLLPEYINIHLMPVAKFSFENDHPDILTPLVKIKDESINGYSWFYDLGDQNISEEQNPAHHYPNSGRYRVQQIVKTDFGCLDTTFREITVKDVFTLYIPNSFTPNNDGKNDEFYAIGLGITDFVISIYDRWGNQVFYADEINKPWNGMINDQPAKEDTYFYIANAKDIFRKAHSINGQVSVVR
jgi:gliding motility-associated-like protein